MKKISHAIVMVEDIHSSLPRTEFSETDLDEAARLLLKIEGVITPPILLQSGLDSYKVIEGDFEYYAALRAGEIDPSKGETINAYLVDSEKEVAVYKKQADVFRQRKFLPQPSQLPSQPVLSEVSHEARIVALEKAVNELNVLPDAIKHLSDQMANLAAAQMSEHTKIQAKIQALLEKREPVESTPEKRQEETATEQPRVVGDSAEEIKLLEDINGLSIPELEYKLKRIKTSKNILKNIIEARQNPSFQPFKSRYELFELRIGVQQKTFDTILKKYKKLT